MFKKQRKIRVRKSDTLRSMLTEVLPYEVPILFTNVGLYEAYSSKSEEKSVAVLLDELLEKAPIFTYKYATVPYHFRIRKTAYEGRGLALIHPAAQRALAEIYTKYGLLMTALCQRSPFWLRAPAKIASFYVERRRRAKSALTRSTGVEEVGDGFLLQASTPSSYFSYRNYSFLHRFYDSTEFIELERRYRHMGNLDISDCFNRIYTHSIGWAVKSKAYCKQYLTTKRSSFEEEFDETMQKANYGETAGIVIGPEASRIFAEIILQKIDLEIVGSAKLAGLVHGQDFEVRRYVDDYFIYVNGEDDYNKIRRIISDTLQFYKLGLNNAKSKFQARPFITPVSIARAATAAAVADFFSRNATIITVTGEDGRVSGRHVELRRISNPARLANQIVTRIKQSLLNAASYDECANYFFGTFKKNLAQRLDKDFKSSNGDTWLNMFSFVQCGINILFFYYSMTPRVRQTHQVCESLLMMLDFVNEGPEELAKSLKSQIMIEARQVISRSLDESPDYHIEISSLMIVLKALGEECLLDSGTALRVFGFTESESGDILLPRKLDYFRTVTALLYFGDTPKYAKLTDQIFELCRTRFDTSTWNADSELVHLLLDLLACPFFDDDKKKELVKTALRKHSQHSLNMRASRVVELASSRQWFIDWAGRLEVLPALRKKQLRTPY